MGFEGLFLEETWKVVLGFKGPEAIHEGPQGPQKIFQGPKNGRFVL